MRLSTKIFLGLGVGLATGLFFGEEVAFLARVGDVFVQLLKMAVLPYIVLSLISGLGRLNYREAGILCVRVGGLLVVIWVVTVAVVLVLPLTFPVWTSASFFSTTLLTEPESFDFLRFIPANPFHAMANAVVPAVVLFSIAVGVALMGIENKHTLLENLEILQDALTRVMKYVMRLTPLGVFAIAASAAGTMSFEELDRLQVYILTYIGGALLMTFWVLPALVTMFTPLRYRDIVGRTKDALVTAFAMDNLLIVLPILAEQGKELMRQGGLGDDESASAVDVIVPASFNFPHAGKLLQLSFLLFAAWFTGTAISLAGYVSVMVSGLLSFFGKPVVAMPFLLDLLRIPADMFQLYLVSGILAARFGTVVSVMQTFALAVLGAFAMAGLLRFRWTRCVRATALTMGLLVTFVVTTRLYFTHALDNAYDKGTIIEQMQILQDAVPVTVYESPPPIPAEDRARPTLDRIGARGVIRVGYVPGHLPFAYTNAAGDLVGFDAAMAHKLARELQVALAFVPVEEAKVGEALTTGYCDIVMSGLVVTPGRTRQMAFSVPYLELTKAFLVQDHRRAQFNSRKALHGLLAPRIAVYGYLSYYVALTRELVPQAELVPITTPQEFFEARAGTFDALSIPAEMGSAWSLLHPEYTVAIPYPEVMTIPMAYPVARGDQEMVEFVSAWVALKKKDHTIQRLYDYWILGKNAVPPTPRWSVIRDVLHWVK